MAPPENNCRRRITPAKGRRDNQGRKERFHSDLSDRSKAYGFRLRDTLVQWKATMVSARAMTLAATQWITAIATVAAISAYGMASMTHASAGDDTRRLISAHGQTIEAFVFGEGPETLIMAAGNGRPASQLMDLAKAIASIGIRA